MIAAAVAGGAISSVWVVCMSFGVPPFFMGLTRLPPCDLQDEPSIVRRLSVTSAFALSREGEFHSSHGR
jgi:hypothetical protein